jgi:UDP-glucose 4-epimerase
MVVGDILDRDTVNTVVSGAKYLYHFAGIADIAEAKERPFDTINLNVMGTTVALEAAVKSGVERFIYASTMYVYSPYGSFYRASKQATETIIEAYSERFELDFTHLRYGSLYGPRSQAWNGLRRYVSQVIREGKLDYYGTGKERREYIHVHDAARLSVNILDEIHKNKAITVTGHQVLNSEELIDLIFEISGIEKNVIFSQDSLSQDHYVMTPYRYTPAQAKKLVPDQFIDLGQGVLEIIEYVHQELDNSK